MKAAILEKYISKLFDEKKIKPPVDEIYELHGINEALNKVKQGKSKGKTIRTIIPFGIPLNEVKQNSKKGFDERVVWDKS